MNARERQFPTTAERWSDASIQEVIETWKSPSDEVDRLWQLQQSMADLEHWKNSPSELVRYLRGPMGPDHAERLFRDMIDWRLENGVDTVLQDYKPPPALLQYCPTVLLKGTDREGDPVYLERAGVTDGFSLMEHFTKEELLQHVVWRREICCRGAWIDDYVEQHGHSVRQLLVIFDLKGFNARHLKHGVIPFFKEMIQYTELRYYGVSKKIIVIRAPTLFRMAWRMAKHFIKQEVKDKMEFAGPKDYLEVLDKHMDLDILPGCVNPNNCGTDDAEFVARGMPPHLDGGILPSDNDDAGEGCEKHNQQRDDDLRSTCSTEYMYSRGRSPLSSLSSSSSSSLDGNEENLPQIKPKSAKLLIKGTWKGCMAKGKHIAFCIVPEPKVVN